MKKTALITGANKGIGFEIGRQLGRKGWRVLLGIRNTLNGRDAEEKLQSLGIDAVFVKVDVADPDSIINAAEILAADGTRIDVLINNAAILEDRGTTINTPRGLLEKTLMTNTSGPFNVILAFLPLLGNGSRIINISSGLGVTADMKDYAAAYSISKAALNAVTKQFAAALAGREISVNAVCPGWVKTSMGGAGATRSVEKGAETPVWLATEADSSLTGKFFRDKKEIPF
ncbi:MAG: SDR family NAD(P)-dependent oxidoreductase [Ignavibacteriales bacterium]|nr:SDR family NAD(P)-dependent oxidoreductase [Ignavibacteriales bacterium]